MNTRWTERQMDNLKGIKIQLLRVNTEPTEPHIMKVRLKWIHTVSISQAESRRVQASGLARA